MKYKFIKNEFFLAFIPTIFIYATLYLLNVKEYYDFYDEAFKSIISSFNSGLIGFLGIVLAGAGIFVSLFDKETKKQIRFENPEADLSSELRHFYKLARHVIVLIFIFTTLYLVIHSPNKIINIHYFNIMVSLVIYYISYVLLYTLDLIRLLKDCYSIVDTYEQLGDEKNKIEIQMNYVNEILLDYLFKKSIDNKIFPFDKLTLELNDIINNQNLDDKTKLEIKFLIQEKLKTLI